MLSYNGDNATSNDTQTVALAKKKNSFEECNRGRCFNHTVQLAGNALLRPFTSCLQSTDTDDDAVDDNLPELEDIDDEEGLEAEEDTEEIQNDDDDEVDELDALADDEKEQILEETAVVRQTITKVCRHSIQC